MQGAREGQYHIVPISEPYVLDDDSSNRVKNECVDPEDEAKDGNRRMTAFNEVYTRYLSYSGWQKGIIYCIAAAMLVMLLTVSFLVWASTQSMLGAAVAIIFEGDCVEAKDLSTASHVVINILSTLLLGASNYCMHIACSPSRRDIDRMHARKKTLQIGINSVSNVFKLPWNRRIAWCILGLSSIPLYLISNSIIYSTTNAYYYTAALVTTDFLKGQYWNSEIVFRYIAGTADDPTGSKKDPGPEWHNWMDEVNEGRIQLTPLDNKACVEAYATAPFTTSRGNLLLLADASNPNTTSYRNNPLLTTYLGTYDFSGKRRGYSNSMSYNWLCARQEGELGWGRGPRCSDLIDRPDSLSLHTGVIKTVNDTDGSISSNLSTIPIKSCLGQQLSPRCTVEASLLLTGAVIFFIICKIVCMVWMSLRLADEPLAVLGDAVASSVNRPDPATVGACLATPDTFKTNGNWMQTRKWSSKTQRWGRAVSITQWLICSTLHLLAIAVATFLITVIVDNLEFDVSMGFPTLLRTSRFNTVNPTFMFLSIIRDTGNAASTLFRAVLLANTPQLVVSLIYISYNSVFSSMLMGLEWSQYAHIRRPLRVSYPKPGQRSTYRLQIPYRYGVPMMILVGSMHFFVSQSIYMVRLRIYTPEGMQIQDQFITTCGFSVLAWLVTTILVAVPLLVVVVACGFRTYRPGMARVRCNSAAISAACHSRPEEEEDAALKPLLWGEVTTNTLVGHCCFSTGPVILPVKDLLYA
ncbi:unnamed protein product [Periconia digitata]|uniref:DUF6536 domain-containing protein n=1 Tax=Periconia digitata TaxID=1303443 RepID=A0A9W4US41_9PLEO|nr:unnamed protein product [Periconia digitata]